LVGIERGIEFEKQNGRGMDASQFRRFKTETLPLRGAPREGKNLFPKQKKPCQKLEDEGYKKKGWEKNGWGRGRKAKKKRRGGSPH